MRCCLNCGSLFPQRNRWLCDRCGQLTDCDESKSYAVRRLEKQKLEALCLWDWIPWKNDALSNYLAALKGQSQMSEWNFLAQRLIQKRMQKSEVLSRPSVIVPAPSLRAPDEDHALSLALAVGAQLGIAVSPMLVKVSGVHQRGLRKYQRQRILIAKHENFSQVDLSRHKVIFIDDVLTTGVTASSSLRALAPMKSHEIWCLAQRALL